MNYIKNNKLYSATFIFIYLILIWNSKIHAQSAWGVYSSNTNIPNVSNYDNVTIQKLLNIKKDFNAGETISASEMNEKFEQIFSILEDLTNVSVDAEPITNILIYGSEGQQSGNFGGINGANGFCTSDQNRTNLQNFGNITCTEVKAILETSNQTIETLYPNQGYKFYSYKGELIAESWDGFLNWQVANFASWEQSVWSGKNGYHCQDWSSLSNDQQGNRARIVDGQTIQFNDGTASCNSGYRILCSCKFYSN